MKKYLSVIPLILLLCFVVGCQDKASMAELEEFKAQAALEKQNQEFVTHYFEELNKKNIEIVNEVCDPDYLYYSPSINPNPISRDEVMGFVKMVFQAFPDINYKIEKVYYSGNTIIIWNSVTGTHLGEFEGIPASGNKIHLSSILIWTLKNGKIVEEREEYDSLGLMMQLGMELKPKE